MHSSTVAKNTISAKDLVGAGSLGLYNIIFCKDLYSNAADNIKAYLQKQAQLIKKGTPKNFNSNLEFVYNTMYQTNGLIRADKLTNKDRVLNGLKLNSFATINNLEQKWTGEVSTKDDNAAIDNDALIKQINSLEEAAQVLVVLNLKFASNQELKAVINQYKEPSTLMAKSTTSNELHIGWAS